MKKIIRKWLGIERENRVYTYQIEQIRETIYDKDALDNGFAVSKIVEKKTILFGGKQKPVR